MGYVLTKSGFFVFSQCPRGLSSQAFANTIAPSAASVSLNRIPLTPATSRTSASRRASIGLVRSPARRARLAACARPACGARSCHASGGSRSSCRRGADRWRGGLRNDGRSDFGALMTKRVGAQARLWPSTFCVPIGPICAPTRTGRMKPTGGFRRQRAAGAGHVAVFNGSSTVRQVQQNVAMRP